jgi:NAD(P)-dependent dehydrogenase (short-subunit alcohol dehydrogenase family)
MAGRMQGRVAIVTGAGGGIGRTVAMLLASEGAAVVVNDLGSAVDGSGKSVGAADTVVAEIEAAGGRAVASYDSVAEFESAGALVQTAISSFGRLDAVCHAAGILRDRMVFNMTEQEWDAVLSVHLQGAFNVVRNAVPHLIERQYGRIVLLASISGLRSSGQTNYAAAKEGMVGLLRSVAGELAPHGITANAIYPGGQTRMTASIPDTSRAIRSGGAVQFDASEAEGLRGLLGMEAPAEALDPANNAAKIVYLCTEASGPVSGQVISSTGWDMSLYSRRRPVKFIHSDTGWTVAELEKQLPISLAAGEINPAPQQPSS